MPWQTNDVCYYLFLPILHVSFERLDVSDERYSVRRARCFDALLFEFAPRLGYMAVERLHLVAEEVPEFGQNFLFERVVLQCHFALHFGVVYDDGAESAARFRSVERGPRFSAKSGILTE